MSTIDIIDFLKNTLSFKGALDLKLTNLEFESGNISLYELFCIAAITNVMEPHAVMEFGTFNGRTTINIANNLPQDSRIFTVDLFFDQSKAQGQWDKVRTRFALANGKNDPNDELGFVGKRKLFADHPFYKSGKIHQIWSDTAMLDPTHPEWYEKIDLFFIDASHTYENCYNDSWIAYEIIKRYGIIIWHDYGGWEGVTKAVDQIKAKFTNYIKIDQIKDTSLAVGIVLSKGGMALW